MQRFSLKKLNYGQSGSVTSFKKLNPKKYGAFIFSGKNQIPPHATSNASADSFEIFSSLANSKHFICRDKSFLVVFGGIKAVRVGVYQVLYSTLVGEPR